MSDKGEVRKPKDSEKVAKMVKSLLDKDELEALKRELGE